MKKENLNLLPRQKVPLVYELSYVGFKSREVTVEDYDFKQITLDNNNKWSERSGRCRIWYAEKI